MKVFEFSVGQCWISEAEPELGIGFVKASQAMVVEVEYPAVGGVRLYNTRTAPLRRLEFRPGERIKSADGSAFEVVRSEVRKGLIWYLGTEGELLCETSISPEHRLQRPMERFLAGQADPLGAFELRRMTHAHRSRLLGSPVRGLLGPRVMLLPHQAYVVSEVARRGFPRALLADEVGLGKTIEAGWILHQLQITERARRILVLVPQALVNQWFVEMLRRFNMAFWVPESQSEEAMGGEDLADHERFIFALESLDDPEIVESILALQWDMVVVDEAHRVTWTPDDPSEEYQVLEKLAAQSRGLLLLTATPEQLGLEGHFARLRLVDPQRFTSLEKFLEEHAQYRKVVSIADALASDQPLGENVHKELKKLLKGKVPTAELAQLKTAESKRRALLALVDYFGTGRIYFRNSRQVVSLEDFSFPERTLETHALETPAPVEGVEPSPRARAQARQSSLVAWLAAFVKQHPGEKVLLICSTASLVMSLKELLWNEHAVKAVEFHEDLPLLARDRNAAFFEDPDGASVLLSSEVGGEGRNFQHASHLVLADLPLEPDVLEQRIGRLDRIGQKNAVRIHVPYFPHSREQVLLEWYDGVFGAFKAPAKGAGEVHDAYFDALEPFLLKPALAFSEGKPEFQKLIQVARKKQCEVVQAIEQGRDRLIELNSFDPRVGRELVERIEKAEQMPLLRSYMESIFDGMGIHTEALDPDTLFAEPGDTMFSSYFPALPAEGMRVAFSRSRALARDDVALMSWDHPMVVQTMDAILAQEFGNVSAAALQLPGAPPVLVEAHFVLEAVEDAQWYPLEFLPTRPIRILLDAKTRDSVGEAWPEEKIHAALSALTPEQWKSVRRFPAALLRVLLEKATQLAEAISQNVVADAISEMQGQIGREVSRLESLQGKNALVGETEIQWWKSRQQVLEQSYQRARVRLDAFLIIAKP